MGFIQIHKRREILDMDIPALLQAAPAELWYGLVGGLLAEIFGLWKLRHELKADLPPYLKSWFYWSMTVLMIAGGGVLTFVYLKSGITLSPLLAVNVGASAPLLIGSLTAAPPKVNQ